MDILELLYNEIKERKLTVDEAIRYIYIRTCEIFSFDYRYHNIQLFNNLTKEDLVEYKPNIRNIDNYEVVCKPYCEYILKVLLEELLNLDVSLVKIDKHYYIETLYNDLIYTLDATISDIAGIKFGLETLGYHRTNLTSEDKEFIDKKIGYINDYYNYFSMELSDINHTTSYVDIYMRIKELLGKYHLCNKYPSDSIYLIKYIEELLMLKEHKSHNYLDDKNNICRTIEIIDINYEEKLYYNLLKKDGLYTLEQINKDKYKTLLKK